MEFVTKYYGILRDFDFDKININSFKKLVESGIFDEHELSDVYKNDEENFVLDTDIREFFDFFIYNKKEYYLKKEIYAEMIYVKNWLLETFNNVSYFTEEIEVLLISEFLLENKLIILEENYKKYFNKIKDKQFYPLFKNETLNSDSYENWEEYFISDIVDNENYKSVANFLNGKSDFLNKEIANQWNEYFVISKISDFCEKKKNLLLNIKDTSVEKNLNNIHLSFQISLFEEILNIKDWSELSATKKGLIISQLLGKNKDNIKKIYLEFDKIKSDVSEKYLEDRNKASELIKKLLG